MSDDKPKNKKVLYKLILIIGICLAVAGGITFGIGFSTFFSDPFGTSFNTMGLAFGLLFPGIFLTFIGFCLNFYSTMDETARKHFDDDSEKQYDEYGRVVRKKKRKKSGTSTGYSTNQQIRINCTLCGELNDQDATFCENCGERL